MRAEDEEGDEFSVCYQASLLHEEGRPVTFRVALAEPECFSGTEGPPGGLHRLALRRSRPFDEHELRRLAPAAVFQRALIGVVLDANGELRIWGIVHSGPRWLQAVRGGRRIQQSVPPVLMAAVIGPGRVLVSRGTTTLAALANGTLADAATDVFPAPWLASFFTEQRGMPSESPAWSALDPAFGPHLAEHVLRRIVATVRGARHGGTLVLLPAEHALEVVGDGRYLAVKYAFADDEPRRRIFMLTVQIRDALARLHVRGSRVGWAEYEASADPRLAALDEALFEVAHLVAMLADVDGAVVLTDRLEILGFGAEISGALPEVGSVDRSLDLSGRRTRPERTERVGTRHRSAYRLCQHRHDALVVVVSQDGCSLRAVAGRPRDVLRPDRDRPVGGLISRGRRRRGSPSTTARGRRNHAGAGAEPGRARDWQIAKPLARCQARVTRAAAVRPGRARHADCMARPPRCPCAFRLFLSSFVTSRRCTRPCDICAASLRGSSVTPERSRPITRRPTPIVGREAEEANGVIVGDDREIAESLGRSLSEWGYESQLAFSAERALRDVQRRSPPDRRGPGRLHLGVGAMSGLDLLSRVRRLDERVPVILMTGMGSIAAAVDAMRGGAFEYLTKPFDALDVRAVVERAVDERRRTTATPVSTRGLTAGLLTAATIRAEIVAKSEPMKRLRDRIELAAASSAPVLVLGESGAGKELVARALHAFSPRRTRPFVAVNARGAPRGAPRERDLRPREDLYYRLNVVPIYVPPLRSRREDIPDLARHFLEQSRDRTPTSPASSASG